MKRITLLVLGLLASTLPAKTKHNVLWVVDSSASLTQSRQAIAESFEEFHRILKENGKLDYRMALTTTDFFQDQGGLVSAEGVTFVDSSSAPVKDFVNLMLSIQDGPTSFWEQGLESSYVALRHQAKSLVEYGVPLSVIYISDENDYSCKDECWGVEPEHNDKWVPHVMGRYEGYFAELAYAQKIPVSIYPVVATEDSPCTLASVGTRYLQLQASVGKGIVGSACPQTIRENILKIAKDLAKAK